MSFVFQFHLFVEPRAVYHQLSTLTTLLWMAKLNVQLELSASLVDLFSQYIMRTSIRVVISNCYIRYIMFVSPVLLIAPF